MAVWKIVRCVRHREWKKRLIKFTVDGTENSVPSVDRRLPCAAQGLVKREEIQSRQQSVAAVRNSLTRKKGHSADNSLPCETVRKKFIALTTVCRVRHCGKRFIMPTNIQ